MSMLPTITCEKGLGHMLTKACAVRFRIANGQMSGPDAIKDSKHCKNCPHGETRSLALPKHLDVAPQSAKTSAAGPAKVGGAHARTCKRCGTEFTGRFGTEMYCNECRFKPRTADAPAPKAPPAAQPQQARPPAKPAPEVPVSEGNKTCQHCSKRFQGYGRAAYCSKDCKNAARPATTRRAAPPNGMVSEQVKAWIASGNALVSSLDEKAKVHEAIRDRLRAELEVEEGHIRQLRGEIRTIEKLSSKAGAAP